MITFEQYYHKINNLCSKFLINNLSNILLNYLCLRNINSKIIHFVKDVRKNKNMNPDLVKFAIYGKGLSGMNQNKLNNIFYFWKTEDTIYFIGTIIFRSGVQNIYLCETTKYNFKHAFFFNLEHFFNRIIYSKIKFYKYDFLDLQKMLEYQN